MLESYEGFRKLHLEHQLKDDEEAVGQRHFPSRGEEMSGSKRCWAGSAVMVTILAAAACVIVYGSPAQEAEPPSQGVSAMQMKVAKHPCMSQCDESRRLKEKPDPAIELENCMEECPSTGFKAVVEFEGCKAACESKHPQSGKMAKMPAEGPPMEACKQKCAEGLSGNFWRQRLQRCSSTCAIQNAAKEVLDQIKYNISSPERPDLEAEVVSVLKKRITFKKRPSDHPYSQAIFQCKTKVEDALAKALGGERPSVVMRPFQKGIRRVVKKDMEVDPGNDLEAVVDVEALSSKTLEKLAQPGTLKVFDQELKDAIAADYWMSDLVNLHPALAMEYSTASLAGDYESMGWHTVCRRDKADTTLDGYGTSKIVKDQTLNSCSQLCNNWKSFCYGFEFRAREKRCEVWTAPICYHTEAADDIQGSSFTDFRCFKRCHV